MGHKKGPREIFWVGCIAAEVAEIQAMDREAAIEQLTEELGGEPENVFGPFYKVKGLDKVEADRFSVTLSARELRYTNKQFEGVLNGWKFVGSGIKATTVNGVDYRDNELISPQFETLVDPENRTPKPKLQRNSVIRADQAEDLQEL